MQTRSKTKPDQDSEETTTTYPTTTANGQLPPTPVSPRHPLPTSDDANAAAQAYPTPESPGLRLLRAPPAFQDEILAALKLKGQDEMPGINMGDWSSVQNVGDEDAQPEDPLDDHHVEEEPDSEWEGDGPKKNKRTKISEKGKGKSVQEEGEGEKLALAKKEKAPRQKKQKFSLKEVAPDWTGKEGVCYFFQCPAEILDFILGDEVLGLNEHLSLASTCKALRCCYYAPIPSVSPASQQPIASSSNSVALASTSTLSNTGNEDEYPLLSSLPKLPHSPLWDAIKHHRADIREHYSSYWYSEFPRPSTHRFSNIEHEKALSKIWSNEAKVKIEDMVLSRKYMAEETKIVWEAGRRKTVKELKKMRQGIRSVEWKEIIDEVTSVRLTKSEAMRIYKVNDRQLRSSRSFLCFRQNLTTSLSGQP
ncbi:hypothetical protein T439DRAFT_198016 [Meredithblackwellia eburnea MCA 4105]